MASALFSEDLTCSICLILFTDPVTLSCGHSFCRRCVTDALNTKQRCPLCQTAVSTEDTTLRSSHILRSLAEKAKEAEKLKKERGHEASELCPEHEEKLKLFCVTDQQLACIICRDGEKHEGHRFKPIKEAVAALRKELEVGVETLCSDILAIESLVTKQKEEIKNNKERSQQLMTQIHSQFEEMHQFLRKREDEIKNELKLKEEDGNKEMNEALNVMETALSESRELEVKVASVLKIEDPERFLKSWSEGHSGITHSLNTHSLKFRATKLKVVTRALSLEPYESHLQFFVWKQMLQMIQNRAEQLTLKSNSRDVTISKDGRSLFCTAKNNQPQPTASAFSRHNRSLGCHIYTETYDMHPHSTSPSIFHAFSVQGFHSGQHYWEVDVGNTVYWELGIENCFLKRDDSSYSACGRGKITKLVRTDKPRKIGIYLSCSSLKLSFYDADTMAHIRTLTTGVLRLPVSAYFTIDDRSVDPMTVCWY